MPKLHTNSPAIGGYGTRPKWYNHKEIMENSRVLDAIHNRRSTRFSLDDMVA